MKLPNKIVSYRESIISKFPILLSAVEEKSQSIQVLYNKTYKHFDTLSDFIETLDALFLLKKIEMDKFTGDIRYVD